MMMYQSLRYKSYTIYRIWKEGRHNSFESLLKKLDIKELNQCFRNDIESKGKQNC